MRGLMLMGLCALAVGCEGAASKTRPQAAKPVVDGPSREKVLPVAGPRPSATDPAARDAITALILAHTENNPKALDAFRQCTVRRKGEMNQGGAMIPADCVDRAAWPDRYRGEWTFAGRTLTIFVNGDQTLKYAPWAGHDKPVAMDGFESTNVLEDLRATWMTLLIPLSDAGSFLAERVADPPALRVFVRDQPPLLLQMDAKTGLLSRVDFEKAGDGRREIWRFELSEYKTVRGVKMPGRVVYTAGRQPGAVWSSIEYEPLAEFPTGTFDKP